MLPSFRPDPLPVPTPESFGEATANDSALTLRQSERHQKNRSAATSPVRVPRMTAITCLHPNEGFSRSDGTRYLLQPTMFFLCTTAARRHGAQRSFRRKIAEGGYSRSREIGLNEKNVVGIDGIERH